MTGAYFGRPERSFVPGGTHITVTLIPVFEGRLVVFDVAAKEARGRWLPWDILRWGDNPYICASELVDGWCDGAVTDLALVDVLSFQVPAEGWELAIVFRAELSALPPGDDARRPFAFPTGHFDAVGNFDPVDLERWVTGHGAGASEPATVEATGLLF